ncbi:hypothetical protein WN55_06852, partial [Dufourea novaeangliae]
KRSKSDCRGHFNAGTGREGGEIWEDKDEGGERGVGSRKSKDSKVNAEGKKLCRYLEEQGWGILNGNMKGDEEGEWTYTGGKGNSVIDYIIGNEETREKVEKMKVEERVESDHHPITVWVSGRGIGGERRRKKFGEKRGERGNWTEEGGKAFIKNFGKGEKKERSMDEDWSYLKGKIKEAIGKTRKRGEKGEEKKGWWDEECREEKSKVRKELKRWRQEGGEGEKYREMRKV